jgi:hypothetical protein
MGWRAHARDDVRVSRGPDGESEFESDADREAAWHHYRDEFMEPRGSQPGDRPWAYWRYEVGREKPRTRLEQVLALADRGELTDLERERIESQAAHARRRFRCDSFTSPKEARHTEAEIRADEDELIAIAEAL